MAQRLVRRLCDSCKQAVVPTETELEQLGIDRATFNSNSEGHCYRPVGCNECLDSGYRGRIAIFELLVVDDDESSAAPPVLITLSETGALSWNGAPANASFLSRETTRLVALNEEQTMVLMPAGAANIQQVSDIMDVLHHAGARSITLERDVFEIDLADF